METTALAPKWGTFARLTLRALRYRNYRLFAGGQSLSLVGTWMQHTAMGWLVYRVTDSALLLGIVGFSGQIFSFLLAPFGGVLADRFDRRRLLIWTQSLAALQAAILTLLVYSDIIRVWHIVLLSCFLGIVTSFDAPSRHSFVADLIDDREDLVNAVALNASIFHGARLVGPAAAGLLIRWTDEGACFLLNAASFLAVIFALAAIRPKYCMLNRARRPVLEDFMESVAYVKRNRQISPVMLLIALVGLLGMPHTILMPVFARDYLHAGPGTLGALLVSSGIGAFAATVFLASRKNPSQLRRVIRGAVILFPTTMMAFALSQTLWLSLAFLFLSGFGVVCQVAGGNAAIQLDVDEDKRGRVMGLVNTAFLGMAPFGSLITGFLALEVGARTTVVAEAVILSACSLYLIRKLPC
ncbi:MAG: MFS transporter [Geobacteraceae bacterium]|nr:MFS transporter [Geobacteraceae bacterium]